MSFDTNKPYFVFQIRRLGGKVNYNQQSILIVYLAAVLCSFLIINASDIYVKFQFQMSPSAFAYFFSVMILRGILLSTFTIFTFLLMVVYLRFNLLNECFRWALWNRVQIANNWWAFVLELFSIYRIYLYSWRKQIANCWLAEQRKCLKMNSLWFVLDFIKNWVTLYIKLVDAIQYRFGIGFACSELID